MSKFSNVSVEKLITPTEKKDALNVRIAVFVYEQKYSMESELDR